MANQLPPFQLPLGISEEDAINLIEFDRKYRMEEEAKRSILEHPVNYVYNTVTEQESFNQHLNNCIKMVQQNYPEIKQRKKFIMKIITQPKQYYLDPSQ